MMAFIKKLFPLLLIFSVICDIIPKNPTDPQNRNYIRPYLIVENCNVHDGDTIAADKIFLSIAGNIPDKNQYRFKVDSAKWSDWKPTNGDHEIRIDFTETDTGKHVLSLETCYHPKGEIVDMAIAFVKVNGPRITAISDTIVIGVADQPLKMWITVAGTKPLSVQWFHNNSPKSGADKETLAFDSVRPSDQGTYFCVATNPWGRDTSVSMLLTVKEVTNKPVFWNFFTHQDTVFEGDSILLRIDSLYTVRTNETIVVEAISASKRISIRGDSLFVFNAGARDSGLYIIPMAVSSNHVFDTATFKILVRPRYCTLTLSPDSGSVIVNPSLSSFRWGDSVTLQAIPKTGFLFSEWRKDAAGNDTIMRLRIAKDMVVAAHFIMMSSQDCIHMNTGSLDTAIRAASQYSLRPSKICPDEGTYNPGTIKILGKVRIVFE
jgi:hypothetical protein